MGELVQVRKIYNVACPECESTDVALYGVATDDSGDGELTRIEAQCSCHPRGHEFRVEIAALSEGQYGMKVVVQTATGREG
jgi:hypothetical protein